MFLWNPYLISSNHDSLIYTFVRSAVLGCLVFNVNGWFFSVFSQIIGPRHPLKKDPHLDYEIDSDEEWEEVYLNLLLIYSGCKDVYN